MAKKENILEAWIMVEHLSEGDFNPNDTSKLFFRNFDGKDFYSYFSSLIDAKLSPKNKNGGLVVYCDIFDFNEVIDSFSSTTPQARNIDKKRQKWYNRSARKK